MKVFSAKPIPIKEVLLQVRMVKLDNALLRQINEVSVDWLMRQAALWEREGEIKYLSRRHVIGWCWAKLGGPTRRWLIIHVGNHEYVRYAATAELVARYQQFYIV